MPVPKHLVGQRVGNNRVELVALLGEGSYGCVYRGVIDQNGSKRDCAVKCMNRSNLDAYHLMCQRREIVLHHQVSAGPGVVTLYEAFEEGDYQFIVMEYCSDSDLWEGIADGRYIGKDDLIKDIFIQLLESVEYCHSKSVFHRDIKPENVLLTESGRKVLLADFGLASGSPMSNEMRCGSPWYMSPECWGGLSSDRVYGTAANDVWCLGILLINLVCARHAPWKQATRRDPFFREFIKQPDMLRSLLPLSPEVHDLLARIFVTDPNARISVADFKAAIQNIKQFSMLATERGKTQEHKRRAAVEATSAQPLSIKTLGIIPVAGASSATFSDEDGGIDITDAARDPEYLNSPCLTKTPDSFIRNITIVDTSPQALRLASPPSMLPSSTSSVESDGPVTPDFPATIVELEVSEIADISQDISDALTDPVDGSKNLDKAKSPMAGHRFQTILRAIGAL